MIGIALISNGLTELLALLFARRRITSWVDAIRAQRAGADTEDS